MDKLCSITQAFLILVLSKEHIKQSWFFSPKWKLFGINPVKCTNMFLDGFFN